MKQNIFIFIFSFFALYTSIVHAGKMKWNVAYNNPIGTLGSFNLLFYDSNWAFETGVGMANTGSTGSSSSSALSSIKFGTYLKYMFRQEKIFRPFFQSGMTIGYGSSTSGTGSSSMSFNFSNYCVGGGFYMMGEPVYLYVAGNSIMGNSQSQGIQAQFGFGSKF